MGFDPRHKSRVMLDGPDRAFARSYFKAIGFTDEDLRRPLIGVAHCWAETTPCNWNHRRMAEKVKEGIRAGGRKLTIQDVFEAVGAFNAGKISAAELHGIESHACPGAGACSSQFTANTMSTAFEMLGISPVNFNGVPAVDLKKEEIAIDVKGRRLDLEISARELGKRLRLWKPPKPRYGIGALAKYARLLSSASEGAITG